MNRDGVEVVPCDVLIRSIHFDAHFRPAGQASVDAILQQVFFHTVEELKSVHLHFPGTVEASLSE